MPSCGRLRQHGREAIRTHLGGARLRRVRRLRRRLRRGRRARALGHAALVGSRNLHGGFHHDAWRTIRELARRHGSRGADELTAPWCAQSFLSIHVMRISVALQLAAAVEIMDTIQTADPNVRQARPEA